MVCVRRVTTVSVRLGPSDRKVHTTSPLAATISAVPAHLTQTGTGIDAHAIQPGSIIHAIVASQNAAPAGRNVARMNTPS